MTDSKPAQDGLTRVSIREARREFAEWINRAACGVERIVIERHGKPVAALVCVEDLDFLESQDDALDRKMTASLRDGGRGRRKSPAAKPSRRSRD